MSSGAIAIPARLPAPPREATVFGKRVKVFLPKRTDPRLKLFAIIVAIQTTGQIGLGFKISIAQILVTMGLCLCIELGVFYFRDGIIAWPASALQTGNSISLLLRTSGTVHGDWWSLNGIQYFIAAVCIGLGAKYLIRPGGKHVFNPANVGIVWVLIVGGVRFVFPQYLWWGPLNVPVTIALLIILAGALWLLREPVGMLPMAASFLATFYTLVAIFAVVGRSFIATWHKGPIHGFDYWLFIALSPEVFVFAFFMMSDPRTAPRSHRARLIYGVSVGIVSALLLFPQSSEFGVKLGILSGLTFICGLVPLINRIGEWLETPKDQRARYPIDLSGWPARLRRAVTSPMVISAAVISLSAPIIAVSLSNDRVATEVERGIINPQ